MNTREEKKTIEAREAERRRRIVRGNSFGPGSPEVEEWWSMEKVESFYQECCVGREEQTLPGISAALKVSAYCTLEFPDILCGIAWSVSFQSRGTQYSAGHLYGYYFVCRISA